MGEAWPCAASLDGRALPEERRNTERWLVRVSIGELRNMRPWKSTTERLSRALGAIRLSRPLAQLPQAFHPSPRVAT